MAANAHYIILRFLSMLRLERTPFHHKVVDPPNDTTLTRNTWPLINDKVIRTVENGNRTVLCYILCFVGHRKNCHQANTNLSKTQIISTHWGQKTHICVSKLTITGPDNGLSPGRRQAIIWNNAGMLLIQTLGINVSEIIIKMNTFQLKGMYLKCRQENGSHLVSASMC